MMRRSAKETSMKQKTASTLAETGKAAQATVQHSVETFGTAMADLVKSMSGLSLPIDALTTSGQDSSISIEQDESGTRFTATLQGVDELTGGGDAADAGLDLTVPVHVLGGCRANKS